MEKKLLQIVEKHFEVDLQKKIIFVNFDEQNIPDELRELSKNFGYVVQYQIY